MIKPTNNICFKKNFLLLQIFREKVEKIISDTDTVNAIFANTSSIYTFHSEHLLPEVCT